MKKAALKKLKSFCAANSVRGPVASIPGCDGEYFASSCGKIISAKREKLRVIKQHLDVDGYFTVGISKNKRRRTKRVHRLVALSFHRKVKKKNQVNHKNGVKADNRKSNLEWSTLKENIEHARVLKLYPRGERHHQTSLSTDQVLEIKRFGGEVSHSHLAREYGVGISTISNIRRGIWRTDG